MWATSKPLFLLALITTCSAIADTSVPPEEIRVQPIPLAPPLNARGAELSGLAWYGDDLVLLPQFPRGALYAIPRAQIVAAITAPDPAPLAARTIALDTDVLRERLPDFQGFEAIAFHGDHGYFAIETEARGTMAAWLLRGRVEGGAIQLAMESLTEIPLPAQVFNMAVEALAIHNEQLLAFYEANGAALVDGARVSVFDLDLQPRATLPMPVLEYRLTDATAPDATGRFWVSNYLWPGERGILKPAPDAFAARYDLGKTHQTLPAVERLLELRVTAAGIVAADTPPVYLELDPVAGRNWEGLARLDNQGFLLVTDSHPETLLIFLPHANRVAVAP